MWTDGAGEDYSAGRGPGTWDLNGGYRTGDRLTGIKGAQSARQQPFRANSRHYRFLPVRDKLKQSPAEEGWLVPATAASRTTRVERQLSSRSAHRCNRELRLQVFYPSHKDLRISPKPRDACLVEGTLTHVHTTRLYSSVDPGPICQSRLLPG